MSIEDLLEIEVTSPSKRAEPLAATSAAIYVLTGDEIRRSGMTSIAEALRLVPGLHVARIDASRWAITSRGFNSQFANKLLVLIDGRTVYTHLFSGVYWDIQDVLMEDIDRIEVIRGPGGTLWGANAVNGVINIITKSAKNTQGLLVSSGAGTVEGPFAHARYGAALGSGAYLRGYVKYADHYEFDTATGAGAGDGWDRRRGGLRLDWAVTPGDDVTVQADLYEGTSDSTLLTGASSTDDVTGGNVLARWERRLSETSNLSTQVYYDRTERASGPLLDEDRNTFDLELQHRFRLLQIHDVIWGLGYRWLNDDIKNGFIVFTPTERTDNLVSGFLQDQITLLDDTVQLTIGSKFEHNDYSGFEYQPSIRGMWTVRPGHHLWAAVSRAVRTPSRADDGVQFPFPTGNPAAPFFLISGQPSFEAEKLLAYEVGYRTQPLRSLSLDLTAFYNDYDELRSTVVGFPPLPSPPFPPGTLPVTIGNRATAEGWGTELAANWVPLPRLTLSGWYTLMMLDVNLPPGVTDPITAGSEDDTPMHEVHLRSRLNLPRNLEFDMNLFWVDDVANQQVGDYTRLDLRLGWRPTENVEISLVGQNLVEERHPEYGSGFFSVRSEVPRGMYGKVTVRY